MNFTYIATDKNEFQEKMIRYLKWKVAGQVKFRSPGKAEMDNKYNPV